MRMALVVTGLRKALVRVHQLANSRRAASGDEQRLQIATAEGAVCHFIVRNGDETQQFAAWGEDIEMHRDWKYAGKRQGWRERRGAGGKRGRILPLSKGLKSSGPF